MRDTEYLLLRKEPRLTTLAISAIYKTPSLFYTRRRGMLRGVHPSYLLFNPKRSHNAFITLHLIPIPTPNFLSAEVSEGENGPAASATRKGIVTGLKGMLYSGSASCCEVVICQLLEQSAFQTSASHAHAFLSFVAASVGLYEPLGLVAFPKLLRGFF